jgi:hypothetical protein
MVLISVDEMTSLLSSCQWGVADSNQAPKGGGGGSKRKTFFLSKFSHLAQQTYFVVGLCQDKDQGLHSKKYLRTFYDHSYVRNVLRTKG